jgi:photosystem II stability/assembly factor-like uncharacterized protein
MCPRSFAAPRCSRSGGWALLVLLALSACSGEPEPKPEPEPPSAPVAGTDWNLTFERPVKGRYEDLDFPTPEAGWLISAAGDVLHTADGADTWEVQATGLGHLRSLVMLDTLRGFTGTLDGTLYRTRDGGRDWTDVTASLPTPPGGFCGMAHMGETVHLVGRFAGEVADHFRSTDGGETWQHQDLRGLAGGLVDIAFIDARVGFIGGRARPQGDHRGSPIILRTADGGETWREVFLLGGGRGFAWKLDIVTPSVVYAALQTEDGVLRVARSEDAGATWAVQIVDGARVERPGVQAVAFTDPDHGWVGGFFPGLYETRDGGQSWARRRSPDRSINRITRGARGLVTASRRGVLRLRPTTPGDGLAPRR